jgi:hypothetical protein
MVILNHIYKGKSRELLRNKDFFVLKILLKYDPYRPGGVSSTCPAGIEPALFLSKKKEKCGLPP